MSDRFRVDPAILPLLPPDVRADFDDDGFAIEKQAAIVTVAARSLPYWQIETLSDSVDALEYGTRQGGEGRPFLGDMVDAPAIDGRPEA